MSATPTMDKPVVEKIDMTRPLNRAERRTLEFGNRPPELPPFEKEGNHRPMRPPKPDFALTINPPLVARFRHPEATDETDNRMTQSEILWGVQLVAYMPNVEPNLQLPSMMFCLSPDGDGTIIVAAQHPLFLGYETMLNAMQQMEAVVQSEQSKKGRIIVPN